MDEELKEVAVESTTKAESNDTKNMEIADLEKAIVEEQNRLTKAGEDPEPLPEKPTETTKEAETKAPSKDGQADESVSQKPESKTEKEHQSIIGSDDKDSAFDELAKKKGYKSVDDLAKSYINMEKKLHEQAQEIAKNRKQDATYTLRNTRFDNPDLSTPENFDNWLREQYQIDPIGTASYIARLEAEKSLEGIKEESYQSKFNSELTRLSRNPDTIDFNEPEIQSEIHRIIEQEPADYLLPNGKVNPKKLEPLYYQAKGKLGRGSVKVMPKVNTVVPVEGVSKAPSQRVQRFNPSEASTDDLRNEIMKIQKQLE